MTNLLRKMFKINTSKFSIRCSLFLITSLFLIRNSLLLLTSLFLVHYSLFKGFSIRCSLFFAPYSTGLRLLISRSLSVIGKCNAPLHMWANAMRPNKYHITMYVPTWICPPASPFAIQYSPMQPPLHV